MSRCKCSATYSFMKVPNREEMAAESMKPLKLKRYLQTNLLIIVHIVQFIVILIHSNVCMLQWCCNGKILFPKHWCW